MSDTALSEERVCVELTTCSSEERDRFLRDVRAAAFVARDSHSGKVGSVFSVFLNGWSYGGALELKLVKGSGGGQLRLSPVPAAPALACSWPGHDLSSNEMIEELLIDIHKSMFARLARTLSETVEPQGRHATTPSASPDHIKQWTKSGLITPGKVWLIELPQPSDGQPTHSEQSARLELLGDDMKVTVKGHNGCVSHLNLSADARRALAAVLLEGLM